MIKNLKLTAQFKRKMTTYLIILKLNMPITGELRILIRVWGARLEALRSSAVEECKKKAEQNGNDWKRKNQFTYKARENSIN